MSVVPFLGASYRSQSPNAAVQRTMNWYPEAVEASETKSRVVLYPTPGFKEERRLLDYPLRGMFTLNGRTFVVGGGTLYELTSTLGVISATKRGSVASDTGMATLSSNGDDGHQLFVTSGGSAYILDLNTNVFGSVSPGGTATAGGFVDGYFIALDAATATIYVSDFENGTSWPGYAAKRNTASDRWQSMVISHREIWLFGSQRTDVWYNSGDLFPFAPISGAFIQQGIAARWSAAVLGNRVVWLGQNDQGDGVVFMAQGYQPVEISDKAIAYALQRYSTIADAVGWVYQDQGHSFYVLNFPTAQATWVFDASTGAWHERGWWDANRGDYDAYRINCHTYAFGKHLVGDSLTGAIYDMDIGYYTDATGSPLRRLRQGPHLCDEQVWHVYRLVQLDLETGVGDATTTAPQIMLQWSDDGGHTWSQEHWVSAGSQGVFRWRAIWRRLGRSRDRVFRVVVSDPVPWRLINFYGDVQRGRG